MLSNIKLIFVFLILAIGSLALAADTKEEQAEKLYHYDPKPTDVLEWNDTTPRPYFFKLGAYADPYLDKSLAMWRKSAALPSNKKGPGKETDANGFSANAMWDRGFTLDYMILYENRYQQLTETERAVFRRSMAAHAYAVLDTDVTALPINLMVIDRITVAGEFALLFPQHPNHDKFRDAFLRATRFVDRHYIRPDMAYRGAIGGRYTENIACYEPWAFGVRSLAAIGLYLNDPVAASQPDADLSRWLWYRMNALSPKLDGDIGGENMGGRGMDGGTDTRTVPPQGAHAEPRGRLFVAQGNAYATMLERYDPRTRDAYAWLWNDNKPWTAPADWRYDYSYIPPTPVEKTSDVTWKGAKPNLKSEKIWDYGVIFRHDFATPQEMSVTVAHIQSTYYRWGQNQSGIIYYFADGKAWSWNGSEDTGDNQAEMTLGNQYCSAFATIHDGKPLMIGKTQATENLYDFGFAGQYTIPGNEGYDPWGSNSDYLKRSVTLIGSDCLVIFDAVKSPDIEGDFRWFNRAEWKLPEIVQVKPGVTATAVDNNYADHRNKTQVPACRGVSYRGKGDFLTVVSHKPVTAVATSWGTLVNGVHKVFYSQSPITYQENGETFVGTSGYISGNKMALFDGNRIGTGGIVFEKDPELNEYYRFGFSVEIHGPHDFSGMICGKPGKLLIHLPDAPTPSEKLYIDGQEKPFRTVGNTIAFNTPNSLTGNTPWQFTDQGVLPGELHFADEHAGNARVELSWTGGTPDDNYELESSEQWGDFHPAGSPGAQSNLTITGLKNEVPYLFRVRAKTARGVGPWSEEIISIPTAKTPATPSGLEALDYYNGEFYAPPVMGVGGQKEEPASLPIRWGRVRGAVKYTLERKDGNASWTTLASDLNTPEYDDRAAGAGQTFFYRVLAENLNGKGEASLPLKVHRGATAKAPGNGPAIFGIGFTNITDTGARLVFTTSAPAHGTITLLDNGQKVKKIDETSDTEIHEVEISDLQPHKTYSVNISQTSPQGTSTGEAPQLTIGLRKPSFEPFPGMTYIGIAHPADLASAVQLGAGMARVSPTWDGLEPARGAFENDALDKMTAQITALKQNRIEPLVLLCFSTDWAKKYTSHQMTWRHPAFGPPDDIADWKRYVREVMTRLKGQVRYYEVWNEPDAGYLASGKPLEADAAKDASGKNLYVGNDSYWLGDRYVPLAIAARQVADEVDPDIQLMGPGWNHDYRATRGKICFDRGIQDYLQIYSFHNYVAGPHSFTRWEEATNDQYFKSALALFKEYKVDPSIAVTEWGIESYDQPPAGTGFHSRVDAQRFDIKAVFNYLAMQRITALILHQYGFNDAWSLVNRTPDGTPQYTPAYYTYQWLCKTFNRKPYTSLAVHYENNPDARVKAILLTDSGTAYVAAWLNQHPVDAKSLAAVAATKLSLHIDGLPPGKYRLESLDETGAVQGPPSVWSGGELPVSLPEAGLQAESKTTILRLTKQPE